MEKTDNNLVPIFNRDYDKYKINDEKMIIYKRMHTLNNKNYLIEISKTLSNPCEMNAVAYSIFGNKNYFINIPMNKCKDSNPVTIAKNLIIKNDALSLIPFWRSKSSIKYHEKLT